MTGGDEQELKGDGVYEDHATRYKTAAEYTTIWREILTRSHTGESFTFHGERLSVDEAKLLYPPVQNHILHCGSVVLQMLRLNLQQIRLTLT